MSIGNYETIRHIGEGAFATVFKVRHKDYGYIRALKICNKYIVDKQDSAWIAFEKECKALLQIGNGSHPNIVHMYQPLLIDNRAIVEMDCVEGDSLHDYIKDRGFLPVEEFFSFAEQIADALAYCHFDIYKFLMDPEKDNLTPDPTNGRKYLISADKERELVKKYGVVHNDLHSNNIIRREYDGKYILLDFGLAIQDVHCVKSSSRFDGAIEYSAPEKLEKGEVTPASDIYALGILMYEALCGTVPFPYSNEDSSSPESARSRVYQQHLTQAPPAVFEARRIAFEKTHPGETYRQDYPNKLEQIILKCLAKKPTDRYTNARDLLLDIRECKNKINSADVGLKAELLAAKDEINQLKRNISQLMAEINSLQNENGRLISENKQLNQEISQPKNRQNSHKSDVNSDLDDLIPLVEVEIDDDDDNSACTPPVDNENPHLKQSKWRSIMRRNNK
ncbi:MAG: protein kinase [Prevotella sp.]|nr:protein kinase [Prevotella sp.]MCM1074130.1 protein kinase [Ruminococcus sp.]